MLKSTLLFGVFMSFVFISCTNKKVSTNENNSVDNLTVVDTVLKPVKPVEEYKTIEGEKIDVLNSLIISKSISSKEEVMRAYFPEDTKAKGEYEYDLKIMNTEDMDSSLVILEVEDINDSYLYAIKIIMKIQRVNGVLVVKQIKESYSCYDTKEHTEWSSVPCS